jgi:AraC family transcriptional regulator
MAATTAPALVRLPLGERPVVVNCGLVEHGLKGREAYELPRLWCLHHYFYDVEMETGGKTYAIVPGSVTLIPPRTRIVYNYARKRHRHFFVHFRVRTRRPRVAVPLLQHIPAARDEILDRLQNMQRLLTHSPLHAEILLWGLLWDLAETGQRPLAAERKGPALLEAIEAFVEKRLPERITVAEVAGQVALSTTHVNRVVKSRLGLTLIQLIKKRRLQRAYRLILHSTMPIKLIASECGIGDLQQFNKLMRGGYGRSPRQLREGPPGAEEPTWALDRE